MPWVKVCRIVGGIMEQVEGVGVERLKMTDTWCGAGRVTHSVEHVTGHALT
jgi:hypothetical protein